MSRQSLINFYINIERGILHIVVYVNVASYVLHHSDYRGVHRFAAVNVVETSYHLLRVK